MLEQPSQIEKSVLSAFPYQENEVLLHTDLRMLPHKPLVCRVQMLCNKLAQLSNRQLKLV